jgi:hypothetical protein
MTVLGPLAPRGPVQADFGTATSSSPSERFAARGNSRESVRRRHPSTPESLSGSSEWRERSRKGCGICRSEPGRLEKGYLGMYGVSPPPKT